MIGLALLASPGWSQSDDEAGRPVTGAPGPSTHEVDATGYLTTMFASNNSYRGNTFDIENTGSVEITITGLEVNLNNTSSTNTIDIYWRTGTSVGFESNPAGWTLLGSDTAVVSAGDDVPSSVTMPAFTIQPGELFGFYVDLASYGAGTSLQYTNGGPTTFSNSEISLTTYYGKGDQVFTGGTYTYRQWNGTVIYDFVPVELQSFSVE
jgi:hypothetical protein